MSVVKGSKQYKLQIKPYQPVRRFCWRLFVLLFVVIAVAAAYFVGEHLGVKQVSGAVAERNQLRKQIAEVVEANNELQQHVANLKLGATVDQQASESVRNEVIELKEQIAELEENISFYRGLMAPNENQRGLTIGNVNVIATSAPRSYEYKMVVQQLASKHNMLSGYVNFTVVGREVDANGVVQQRTYHLKDLTDEVSQQDIKLRFKYFQTIRGVMVLPEGFEPERIELIAKSTGANAATVEEKFGWLVQEG